MSTNSSSRNRIPPLIQSVVRLPLASSLLLITGVLDATPYWLVSRFISSALSNEEGAGVKVAEDERGVTKVLLVSWMRDWEYWRSEVRRGAGLDLARLTNEGSVGFVDGITGLFGDITSSQIGFSNMEAGNKVQTPSQSTPTRGSTTLPQRGPAPTRTPVASGPSLRSTPTTNTAQAATQKETSKGRAILSSPSLAHATEIITKAITALASSPSDKILLILDSPTTLLATTSTTSTQLSSFILKLREKVHSTLLVTEADTPFISAANPSAFLGSDYLSPQQSSLGGVGSFSPMEKEHASFVAAQGHNASLIVSTRGLDTGVARDVSGVLRVSRGGSWDEAEDENAVGRTEYSSGEEAVRDIEVLYHVAQDGNVRVFERGGGDVG